jgi:sec-independent protein translocase protein TatC
MLFSSHKYDYPDDIFDDSRMSFGDHIEELRMRLIRALAGLGICLIIGFILDGIGDYIGQPNLGIGRPMMKVIVDPVESQVRNFYARRNQAIEQRLEANRLERTPEAEVAEIRKKLRENDNDFSALSSEEKRKLLGATQKMPVIIPVEPFKKVFGVEPKDPGVTTIETEIEVFPAYLNVFSTEGETLLESRKYITTLSAQEAFMVYFKVSLLCGVVIASPWIAFQIWAFVAAGMYPHERKMVYKYLPFSIGLFLTGVFLCQFVVLPGAVKALLGFNTWIDLDPDLRLNEWLSFALVLPLVFGLSFQTPLVMMFFNRIGMFGWEDYWSKWRYAVFILAVFAALITPTPDIVTMSYLFVPMFGLYCVGVLICKYFPPEPEPEDAAEQEIAV